MNSPVELRPVRADDEAFLLHLFCAEKSPRFAALEMPGEQLDALLRMQFKARDSQYRAQYPNAAFELVLHNAEPIGNFYAQQGPDEYVLIDLTLLRQSILSSAD